MTSGLAAGIDAAAHQAALEAGGCTMAVIGTGPDRAYPDSHARLQARIAAEGVVLSEYLPGTAARPSHFPARNRLVAGLALATVVVEAAQRGHADHRAPGRRGRPRGLCPARIGAQPARGRLPPPDP